MTLSEELRMIADTLVKLTYPQRREVRETMETLAIDGVGRIANELEGKVLVTTVTHEKDGAYCTTFPAVYGCGDTPEESRKVFEQRLEEVERGQHS